MRGRLKKPPSVRAQSRLFCGRDEVENRTRLGTPLDELHLCLYSGKPARRQGELDSVQNSV
jgi:hypothetical protein